MLQFCGSTLWGLLLALTPWRTSMCFSLHSDFMLLLEIPWLHHNSLSLGDKAIFKRGYFLFPGQYISCCHVHDLHVVSMTIKHVNPALFQHGKFSDVTFTMCANSSVHHIHFCQQSSKILENSISRNI